MILAYFKFGTHWHVLRTSLCFHWQCLGLFFPWWLNLFQASMGHQVRTCSSTTVVCYPWYHREWLSSKCILLWCFDSTELRLPFSDYSWFGICFLQRHLGHVYPIITSAHLRLDAWIPCPEHKGWFFQPEGAIGASFLKIQGHLVCHLSIQDSIHWLWNLFSSGLIFIAWNSVRNTELRVGHMLHMFPDVEDVVYTSLLQHPYSYGPKLKQILSCFWWTITVIIESRCVVVMYMNRRL